MISDATDSELDHDLAAMARCAKELIEKLTTFEPRDASFDAGLATLGEKLTVMRGYLINLTQGEPTTEEKQRAHTRALKVFEGMRDYLEKLEHGESSWKIH